MTSTIIKPYREIEYKIYGYILPDVPSHKGYIKIGETTRSVRERVLEQVGTVGLIPRLIFEIPAKKSDGTRFRDKELHRYLILNGIKKKDFNGYADEWFYFGDDLNNIKSLIDKFLHNDYEEIQITEEKSDYILRKEQRKAVEKTLAYYNSDEENKEFLWNAKPRFGKTLTTYDFIRQIKASNVLIVTNRPAVANSWYDDFQKFIAWQEPHMKFVSETDSLNGKALSRQEYIDFLNITEYDYPAQITFISLQDLKGAKFAGGAYEKLRWVSDLEWDLLVIDEAHEGIDTIKADRAFDQISRNFTLHLSGTPFKALASNKFKSYQIYNWSYLDEQKAKKDWDNELGKNPYEKLPTLNLFTYQMSRIMEKKVSSGLQISEGENLDYAFDLNEFFSVKNNGRFQYEDSVIQFLDNLTQGEFPFSADQYRDELNHTFWLLPRVKAAKALERLLKKHKFFKDFHVVLAAGDGISLDQEYTSSFVNHKENKKSFDKVRSAIKRYKKTITLSVGQLTTGVTIPEWTAVFMLNNIESPSLYFQAAFRAQNPYEFEKNNKIYRKETAYIFDFSPDRTLRLYDEFANNLTTIDNKSTSDRKSKIRELLNFLPVIAEDSSGVMRKIDATEVFTIPNKIISKEVVKRGFMSNLLFSNISGIFAKDSPYKEILIKIPPQQEGKKTKSAKKKSEPEYIDDDGNVRVPEEIVIGTTKELFGNKVYLDFYTHEQIVKEFGKELINFTTEDLKRLSENIIKGFSNGFIKVKEKYDLNKRQLNKVKKETNEELGNILVKEHLTYVNKVRELKSEYQIQEGNSKAVLDRVAYSNEEKQLYDLFIKTIQASIQKTLLGLIEKQTEEKEEKKKEDIESDIRAHLRGFARTIPAFLMAYGDEDTNIDNFDQKVDAITFKNITSITPEDFKKLRDGFSYLDGNGQKQHIPGLFNKEIFNSSIQEFLQIKSRLANYFDEDLEEDIFDYIPPQKTNQIFTPKVIVKLMVEALEEENPDIFKSTEYKFIDLYAKSGLFITEIVKKLNKGLMNKIPNVKERIKWILEEQVYACAPDNIIYNIVKEFVYGEMKDVSTRNLIELDTMNLIKQKKSLGEISNVLGDGKLKFDVIIGNPPYQDETIGQNKTYAPPIYHKFLEASYQLSDKVLMIHPARFLFNAGRTPKKWNKKMLQDRHLKIIDYFEDSSTVFPMTDIKGGIVISYRDASKELGPIETFTVYPELRSILKKVGEYKERTMDKIISGRGVYKLSELAHKDYPEIEKIQSKGHKNDIGSSAFSILKDIIFYEEKKNDQYVKILGLDNRKRTFYWMDVKYLNPPKSFYQYKVIMPQANGNGSFGEPISEPLVLKPKEGATETFLTVGGFSTEDEAKAALKYIKTKFARALLSALKITQANTRDKWSKVPIQNFTKGSDINWSKSLAEIDQQLYEKYNLDKKEIEFINENVREME